jgi:hypothetical protein
MEEALYAEDPRFASRIKKTKSRSAQRGRIVIGVVAGIAGLALVIFSAMSSLLWLGAIGFAVMVAGIVYAVTPGKGRLRAVSDDGTVKVAPKSRQRAARSGSFMDRLEERWDRRRRDQW